ncbi:unnamed protein product [Boreogadus saida]
MPLAPTGGGATAALQYKNRKSPVNQPQRRDGTQWNKELWPDRGWLPFFCCAVGWRGDDEGFGCTQSTNGDDNRGSTRILSRSSEQILRGTANISG